MPKTPCNKRHSNMKTLNPFNPELVKNLQNMQQGDQAEDVELRKQGNCRITGKKRVMPISPERESKLQRMVKTMEVNSMAVMMNKCGEILEKLMNHRYGWVFNEPVDEAALGLSDYHKIVKRPMSLGTVKSRLDNCVYTNLINFANDVRLTFNNALAYNREGEDVHTMANVLLKMFNKLFDPAYKKFEVERQRVIDADEHQIFNKPLAEFMRSQRVSSQRNTEKPVKREMSYRERDQLGMVLQDLTEEYMDEILEIVAKRNFNMTTPDEDGEIELEVEALDKETMRDLHSFVRLKFMLKQKNKVTRISC
ncbi:hypothetical protein POM88_047660 [Heracleum sosnowskyi]|uniref:Bromodomain protein n=1 Tax=Heracleum sosnowskyi TaxID=360622 RepID=A0AAD8GUC2_9APIA|nr:hypothetical protein POM88_047660 [Heracleum sosnowskyi]